MGREDLAGYVGGIEILFGAMLSLDEVIAVDRGGNSRSLEARRHKLKEGHLCGGILHRDSIRLQFQVGLSSLDLLVSNDPCIF